MTLNTFILLSCCIWFFFISTSLVTSLIFIYNSEYVNDMMKLSRDVSLRIDHITVEIDYKINQEKLLDQLEDRAMQLISDAEQISENAKLLSSKEGIAELALFMLENSLPDSADDAYCKILNSINNTDHIIASFTHLVDDIMKNHEDIPRAYYYARDHLNMTKLTMESKYLYNDIKQILDLLANFRGLTFIDARRNEIVENENDDSKQKLEL